MKHKKILLGSLAIGITTLVPIATIISCGNNGTTSKKVVIPTTKSTKITYTGVQGTGAYNNTNSYWHYCKSK